jgi:hypothetical protein
MSYVVFHLVWYSWPLGFFWSFIQSGTRDPSDLFGHSSSLVLVTPRIFFGHSSSLVLVTSRICCCSRPFFVMWPKVHFRVMSSTSKIAKGDKQMYLMWTVPITHLRHAFIQCCASFPLLRWEYMYAMAAAIRNMDLAVTWPREQQQKNPRGHEYQTSFTYLAGP